MNECVVMVGCVGIQGEDVLRRSCFGQCQIEPNIIADLTQPCYFRPFSNSRIDSIAREGGAFFLLIVLGWEGEIVELMIVKYSSNDDLKIIFSAQKSS